MRITILGNEVGYFHAVKGGVDFLFVDHGSYPRPGGLYADTKGVYGDNQVRQPCSVTVGCSHACGAGLKPQFSPRKVQRCLKQKG